MRRCAGPPGIERTRPHRPGSEFHSKHKGNCNRSPTIRSAQAVGPLAEHLEADEEEDFPGDILDALAAIGPAAKEALPRLYALREKYADLDEDEDPLPDLDRVIVDKDEDHIGWTIQQIRGQPSRDVSK